jgi:site-specific recombinase XerC
MNTLITMKMRELYEQYYLQVLKENHRSIKTMNGYEKNVQRWEETFKTVEKEEPDVTNISKEHIKLFKSYLEKCRGLRGETMSDNTNTIRRYLRELAPLLAITTPSGFRDCPGPGLHDSVPKIEMPAEVYRDAEDTLTFDEISA